MKKILIVDDNQTLLMLAEMALEEDFTVLKAGSGVEAIELARSQAPDLILLDSLMPEMSGEEAFKILRDDALTSSIPIVFLTAKAQADEIEQYLALGADGVITKPYDPMKLSGMVNQLAFKRQ